MKRQGEKKKRRLPWQGEEECDLEKGKGGLNYLVRARTGAELPSWILTILASRLINAIFFLPLFAILSVSY